MAMSFSHKRRYSATVIVLLVLFLLTICFSCRKALEPTLTAYRDLFSQVSTFNPLSSSGSHPSETNSHISTPNHLDTHSDAEPFQGVGSSEPRIICSGNQTEFVESVRSGLNTDDGNDEIVVKTRNDSVTDHGSSDTVSDNAGYPSVEERDQCDLYDGTWVRDESYPIYEPGSCPYVDDAYDCQTNGRNDSQYTKWRWKPRACDLPRFNATDFLMRLRGKKLMLVGDSMNRNQFESMLCLLREGLPDKSRIYLLFQAAMNLEVSGNISSVTKANGRRDLDMEEPRKSANTNKKNVDTENADVYKKQSMPPATVITKLIFLMVWRKLVRNPNTSASLLGLAWSLISFRYNIEMPKIVQGSISILSNGGLGIAMFSLGLFMALQPKLITCGKAAAALAMAVRFLAGPAVIAATSGAVGLRGVLLQVSIVQAALPQGIVPFVFSKEFDMHADILSTAVIFGMLVAVPVTIVYYMLLGAWGFSLYVRNGKS